LWRSALSAVVVSQSVLLEQARALRETIDSFEKTGDIDDMQTGTIKKLVSDRGFGFIAAEDGKEYFFHRSGTEGDFDSLNGGEKVTFEIEASPKGPRAKSVRVA
jgi:CspA family cold shock protein